MKLTHLWAHCGHRLAVNTSARIDWMFSINIRSLPGEASRLNKNTFKRFNALEPTSTISMGRAAILQRPTLELGIDKHRHENLSQIRDRSIQAVGGREA